MKPLLLLSVSPASGLPLYRQLFDQFLTLIATGKLPPGEFLPSVRQVAQELQVNPMTVSKTYSLLERAGAVELVRGQGMRVLPPPSSNGKLKQRQQAILPLLQQVAATAYQLALSREQVLDLLNPLLEERHHDRH
ncbi:MAG: GntR family transcriptional regulator [Phycisphaerae bacterium]